MVFLRKYTVDTKTGILLLMSIDKLKSVIDFWTEHDLIDTENAAEVKNVMSGGSGGEKYMKDMVHNQTSGSIVFNSIGFISLKMPNEQVSPLGTLVYARTQFGYKNCKNHCF